MDEQIYKNLVSLFSSEGLKIGVATININSDISCSVSQKNDHIMIDFPENEPEVGLKIIKAKISGIKLEKDRGVIILRNLPDIPFYYKWLKNEKNGNI